MPQIVGHLDCQLGMVPHFFFCGSVWIAAKWNRLITKIQWIYISISIRRYFAFHQIEINLISTIALFVFIELKQPLIAATGSI